MKFSKFFSNIQEAPWYRSFLNPVINEIDMEGNLLDIGTGSGKLIQILFTENGINCIGVDTNIGMIEEAKVKLKKTDVKVFKIEANKKLPFKNNTFNYITICSVLFHLKNENIDVILKDAQQLLKKDGKIIVLTPTGNGGLHSITKNYFSFKNLSMYIWFYATKNRAKQWNINRYLRKYANENTVNYQSNIVMKGFAKMEILSPI